MERSLIDRTREKGIAIRQSDRQTLEPIRPSITKLTLDPDLVDHAACHGAPGLDDAPPSVVDVGRISRRP